MNLFFVSASTLVLSLGLSASASAGSVLGTTPGSHSVEGITVAQSAQAEIDGTNYNLTAVGAGLRAKRVVIAKVKVYVGQLFAADPSAFVRTNSGALSSIANQKAAGMQLTFLRGVDAETVQNSFKDALKANGVSLNKSEITSLLNAVVNSGDARDHRTLTFLTSSTASGDIVVYEGTSGSATTIRGPKGFAKDVMSMWLGNGADGGVTDLKEQLLQPLK